MPVHSVGGTSSSWRGPPVPFSEEACLCREILLGGGAHAPLTHTAGAEAKVSGGGQFLGDHGHMGCLVPLGSSIQHKGCSLWSQMS